MTQEQSYLDVLGVTKRFGSLVAVDDVSLSISEGEFVSLLGPSGCGKTTLLRMVAGFEHPNSGRIVLDQADITNVPPDRRPLNMVFQNYALFPHMTVDQNVGYGLRIAGCSASEIRARVKDALAMVRMSGYGDRKPDQLSGGQRQRIALARGLIKRPKVLLLDEPLSALDKNLREEMQLELVRLSNELRIVFVMVTHDQEEAMSVSDRIAVMNHGRIVQVGTPEDIYEHPRNTFVAGFIGAINLIELRECRKNGAGWEGQDQTNNSSLPIRFQRSTHVPIADSSVTLGIRPEKLVINSIDGNAYPNIIEDTILDIANLGDRSVIQIERQPGSLIKVVMPNSDRAGKGSLAYGDAVTVSWKPENAVVLEE